MASYDEVITALRNADAAGNADDARQLAQIASRMKSDTTATPAIGDKLKSSMLTGFKYGGPLGAAIGAIPAASEALGQAAYDTGGKVTDAAAKLGLPAPVAAGAGYAANVGMQAIPNVIGGGGMGKAASEAAPLLEAAGRRTMQSALKPTWDSLRNGDAAKAITTMLDEGYNATNGGVSAIRTQIAELGKQVDSVISNSREMINKNAVSTRLHDTLKRFEEQVNPNTDIAALEKAWSEFLQHPLLAGKTEMPVQLAQKLKQGTYAQLDNKAYGELKGADIEAQKNLARGLKEEISQAIPAVAPLNARESALYNAREVMQRRALMESNKNPIGLPTSFAAVAHDPLATLGMFANSSALGKSLLARLLYSGSEVIPEVGAGVAGGSALGLLANPRR